MVYNKHVKPTRNTNNSGIRFHKQTYNEYYCNKTAKMMVKQNCLQNHIKMLKQPNFFYSQPSTLPKDAPAKFYLSTTFGLSYIISSVAPTCVWQSLFEI